MNSIQRVPYISDIGANILKPFFITGCAATALSFSASLLCVRHNQALIGRVEQLYDRISVVSGITGSAGLVALAVFDTARHHDLHFFCLLVFMGGVILSAASTTYEYSHLGKAFADFEILRTIYFVKLVLVLVEIALSIFFIGAILGRWYMAASCTEWGEISTAVSCELNII
ncbi:hypothetical protein Q9L58_001001 [Maublancomyces gigas]|uniref:CWH43-like N-terminal domain-containing protein n=1 Tax=Discina gigas TaxID=1032678 RepID=A0ABR3GVT2_9PEZI